jgi:hypothetical protein
LAKIVPILTRACPARAICPPLAPHPPFSVVAGLDPAIIAAAAAATPQS